MFSCWCGGRKATALWEKGPLTAKINTVGITLISFVR